MVQLKSNLIPTRMLQVAYYQVKITSCVQYFNWCPLRLCPHQANCLTSAPVNVTLILNELIILIVLYIHGELTNIISVCTNRSLNLLSY